VVLVRPIYSIQKLVVILVTRGYDRTGDDMYGYYRKVQEDCIIAAISEVAGPGN
jgi:hypothetical protein